MEQDGRSCPPDNRCPDTRYDEVDAAEARLSHRPDKQEWEKFLAEQDELEKEFDKKLAHHPIPNHRVLAHPYTPHIHTTNTTHTYHTHTTAHHTTPHHTTPHHTTPLHTPYPHARADRNTTRDAHTPSPTGIQSNWMCTPLLGLVPLCSRHQNRKNRCMLGGWPSSHMTITHDPSKPSTTCMHHHT